MSDELEDRIGRLEYERNEAVDERDKLKKQVKASATLCNESQRGALELKAELATVTSAWEIAVSAGQAWQKKCEDGNGRQLATGKIAVELRKALEDLYKFPGLDSGSTAERFQETANQAEAFEQGAEKALALTPTQAEKEVEFLLELEDDSRAEHTDCPERECSICYGLAMLEKLRKGE